MANVHSFAATYGEARDKFLSAARVAGAELRRYDNPTKGPQGEALSTDVARLGSDDASKIVVTISSTHGVEGYCGSGFQVDWLARIGGSGLPKGTAALFVHAINPYGFAWTQRVTEEGNDLNRNYVDHSKPYPANEGYLEIADALVPADFSEAGIKAADAKLAAYRKRWATSPTSAPCPADNTATPTACSSAAAGRHGPIVPCMRSPTAISRGAATWR